MEPEHIAVVVALLATISDLRSRRIPNPLTIGAGIAGIAMQFLSSGTTGLEAGVAGWLAGVALFLPFFALGGLGAGDVKLLGAIGAWVGAAAVFHVAIYSAMAGGVLGAIVAIRKGYLRTALVNVKQLLVFWSTVGVRPVDGFTLSDAEAPRLAYAVPIFVGLMVSLWLQ